MRRLAQICDRLCRCGFTRRRALSLWPGLSALWRSGSWRGLAVAVVFAAALNNLLAVTLVWHEVASAGLKWAAWGVLAGAWFVAAVVSWRGRDERTDATAAKTSQDSSQDLYPAALNEYLKRNFVAAERLLVEMLENDPRDCAAGLMLATLWRRTDRADDARAELHRLTRLEASAGWQLEIDQELSLLEPRTEENDPSSIAPPQVDRAQAA